MKNIKLETEKLRIKNQNNLMLLNKLICKLKLELQSSNSLKQHRILTNLGLNESQRNEVLSSILK